MRKLSNQTLFIVIVVALVLPVAGTALPAADVPAQSNLLSNGSMEDGFSDRYGDGRGVAPNGWDIWYVDSPSGCNNYRPVYTRGSQAYDGGTSAMIWLNYQSYTAGFKQNVTVPAGSRVRFTAYGRLISADEIGATSSDSGASVDMKIGIDPTGSGNQNSSSIVWSSSANASFGYTQFSVEATAQGATVTVFLYSKPAWCSAENATYFDAASLVVIGEGDSSGGGAAAPQAAAPIDVPIEVAPPRADGSIVHVVQSNQYLNLIAGAYGVSVQQIKDLNGLTSNIIHTNDELLIKPADDAVAATQEAQEAEAAAEEDGTDAQEPSESERPTPMPTTPPQEVAVAQPAAETSLGNLCVLVYHDRNRSGARDTGEGLLAGADVTLSDGVQDLSVYTTTDSSTQEPHCFSGLVPGNYDLMITGVAATAHQNVRVGVPGGRTVRVEHGAVPFDSLGASVQPGGSLEGSSSLDEETADRLGKAALAAAGVVAGMTLLGGLIYAIFLRRRV
jgi:LysM repeat protein